MTAKLHTESQIRELSETWDELSRFEIQKG